MTKQLILMPTQSSSANLKAPPWSLADWLILLLFAGLVMLFYWPILTPNLADRQSFPPGDFSHQFWAFATYEVRQLSAGRLPLWNPYTFAGSPFWADVQAAVFYPPSLLTILLSAPWGFSLLALEIEAITHFWIAASLMYLFMRELTGCRQTALIASLTFTFSGYLTGYPSQQLAVLETVTWLPLILYGLTKAARQTDFRFIILAGVAWGLTLLAGHPQSGLIVAYLSTAYFGWLVYELRITTGRLPSLCSIGGTYLAFLLIGLGLAAIQFIPAVEYTRLSVRAAGTYDKMAGGFPIVDMVQLLLPGLVSHYSPLYIGVMSLILALTVTFSRHQHQPATTFWATVAGVSGLITFGGNTFLYSLLYLTTPGFAIFRGQERWALAVAFSLSVLVGYGFRQLLMLDDNFRANSHQITQYLFYGLLILTGLAFFGLNDTGWTADNPFYELLSVSTFLTIVLALIWLLWRAIPHLSPLQLTALAGVLVCFDLFTINWQTNLYPELPEWHTQMPAVVQAIKNDAKNDQQPFRVYNEFRLYDNYGLPFQLEDLWGASPLRPARYDQFLAPPMPIERAWELFNVKYVITWRAELYKPSTIIYQEPATDGTTYVHRLNEVGPRAWLVHQVEVADDATILQKLADPTFDRWQIALLEESTTEIPPAQAAEASLSQLTYHSPQAFSVWVTSSAPAWLILSEPHYPGWQATIDGQPAPIQRANYVLRAIAVPPGEHLVRLEFWPWSFTIGAGISVLTVIIIIAGLLIKRSHF